MKTFTVPALVGMLSPLKRSLSVPILGVMLAALSETAIAAPATNIDWYLAHPDQRARVIATCGEDPARLDADPDCLAARAAESQASHPGPFDMITSFFEDLS